MPWRTVSSWNFVLSIRYIQDILGSWDVDSYFWDGSTINLSDVPVWRGLVPCSHQKSHMKPPMDLFWMLLDKFNHTLAHSMPTRPTRWKGLTGPSKSLVTHLSHLHMCLAVLGMGLPPIWEMAGSSNAKMGVHPIIHFCLGFSMK